MGVIAASGTIGTGRRYFTWVGVAAAVIVFAGFARSYYLKGAFGTPTLSDLVHLHGVVMTLWFAFFLLQVMLVASRRIDLHRRVGVAGTLLAVLVLVVGVTTAIAAAKRGFTPGPPPLVFLAIPLVDLLVFGILIAAAILFRRRSDIHRRLMLLGTVSILTPAIARIMIGFTDAGGLPLYFGLDDLIMIACVAYDTVKNRRLHPAFGWGSLFIVASQPLRLLMAGSPAWLQFATWLVG